MTTEKTFHRKAIIPLAGSIAALLLCGQAITQADSATWNLNPEDGSWNNSTNWTPNTVPNSETDVATFGGSRVVNVFGPSFSDGISLGAMVFKPGASGYNISTGMFGSYSFFGAGIVNNSGVVQNLEAGEGASISFYNNSTVGPKVVITAAGFLGSQEFSEGGEGGSITFNDNSSAGQATLIATGSALAINAGSISFLDNSTGGQAAVQLYGNGYLDISQHNSGTVTIGSLAGNGLVYLGSNNLAVGSNNLTTVFSGSIVDGNAPSDDEVGELPRGFAPVTGGSFTKVGTGTLFLTGNNTYTGPTIINGGALVVNGSIASAQTFVNPGGTLGGTGFIGGSIYNTGNVQPGDAPGILTVGGSYFQTAGGKLSIEVDGRKPGQFSTLLVQGHAVISPDTTLELFSVSGSPKLKAGQSLPILVAGGGISGHFGTVENQLNTGTILEYRIGYSPFEVSLDTVRGRFENINGLTQNQQAVAGALDTTRGLDKLFNYLDNRLLSQLSGDFDRIAPEELTSIFAIQTALDEQLSLNLQRRTDDIRSGSSGFNAANLAINGINPSYSGSFGGSNGVAGPNGYDGKEMKETKDVAPAENRWGAFLSGTGEWVNVSGTDNARGYELTNGGFTLGADYKVTQNFAVGLMAGYTGTSADLTDHGRVWVNGGKLGLYSTVFSGGWYADAAVNGGYSSYETRRSGLQGDARGDTDGGDLDALFGTGYDFKKGGFTFGPTASFNYTYTGLDSFNEHGSLAPLSNIHGDSDSLRTAFGMKASYDWKAGSMVIRPEVRASWQHEYGDSTYALASSFANGDAAFTSSGPRIGRDSLLVGAGFAIQLNERFETYIYYDGELARTNYESSSVTGGFRVSF
ncbi:MAG TPA: autotransporter domain-containing protein [Chthoniobacter sp.]|jgi:outer membrane autotransporter protein